MIFASYRSCHSLMPYQIPAAHDVSMRDPKTDSQFSSGNRMPPRTKASPKLKFLSASHDKIHA